MPEAAKLTLSPHCDSCGHTSDPADQDNLHSYVGAECPKCGAVMVTESDVEQALAMQDAMKEMNMWFHENYPEMLESEDLVKVELELHTTVAAHGAYEDVQ